MSSSITTRFNVLVAGEVFPSFANPFFVPAMTLEAAPAIYDVVLAASAAGTVWDGTPLPDDFDVLLMQSTTDCDIEFTVDGGEADEYHFTLFLRGGGFPLALTGSEAYAGQTGTQDAFTNGTVKNITKIRALNRDDTNAATISVLLGKEAA
jgi:hypothetical protein